MHIFRCRFLVNHIISIFVCVLFPWLYLCATLYLLLNSVKVLCVSLFVPLLSTISLPFLVWLFTFFEKYDCDITFTPKINLVLSVIHIIKILIKLAQMIWCYVTTLHKKMKFFLKDFFSNCGPNPQSPADFGHMYWKSPLWKTSFFVQW